MTQEITPVNVEQTAVSMVVADYPEYTVVKGVDGKFKKVMKYAEYTTIVAKTEAEKIELFDIMNNDESDKVVPMKNAVGLELHIVNFITTPYGSLDEETGETLNGVTTLIQSDDGMWYATSSKSVYYSLQNITKAFGIPNTKGYKPVKVKITSKRQQRGEQINLMVIA